MIQAQSGQQAEKYRAHIAELEAQLETLASQKSVQADASQSGDSEQVKELQAALKKAQVDAKAAEDLARKQTDKLRKYQEVCSESGGGTGGRGRGHGSRSYERETGCIIGLSPKRRGTKEEAVVLKGGMWREGRGGWAAA